MANSKLDALRNMPTGLQRQIKALTFEAAGKIKDVPTLVIAKGEDMATALRIAKSKYRDPEKRKAYMRDLMRKRRARAKLGE